MKKLIFFNTFHNGDLHLGRSFVGHLSSILPYEKIYYEHYNSPKTLKDIKNVESIPLTHFQKDTGVAEGIIETPDSIFINTWIGQSHMKYVNDYGGCTLDAYYRLFSDMYSTLGIQNNLKQKMDYLPKIDYSCYENIDKITHFFSDKNKNVFISNQEVRSGQVQNFSFDTSVKLLCEKFKDVNFFVTGKTQNLVNSSIKNLYFTSDIINATNGDLNENSFVSTFCNLIIGRSSGPYCFTQTSENYLDPNKTFLCFDDTLTNGFWVLFEDNFIKAKTYAYKFYGEWHLTQTIYNHMKQIF